MAGARPPLIEGAGEFFDTLVRIRADCDQRLIDACLTRCAFFHSTLSRFDDTSDVGRINAAAGRRVRAAPTTARLVSLALEYSRLTGGLFDITLGVVLELWDFKEGRIPTSSSLEEALRHVGSEHVHVVGTQVWLDDPLAKIDLGGIAKGYVADDLAVGLRAAGCEHAVLNLGGNVLCVGSRPDGSAWRAGVARPGEPFGDPMALCRLKDQSLVTSSLCERAFSCAGRRYGHILDPRSGHPVATDVASVTLRTEHSVDGEALGKKPFFLGMAEALSYLDSLEGVDALLVGMDGSVAQTSAGAFELL